MFMFTQLFSVVLWNLLSYLKNILIFPKISLRLVRLKSVDVEVLNFQDLKTINLQMGDINHHHVTFDNQSNKCSTNRRACFITIILLLFTLTSIAALCLYRIYNPEDHDVDEEFDINVSRSKTLRNLFLSFFIIYLFAGRWTWNNISIWSNKTNLRNLDKISAIINHNKPIKIPTMKND